MRRRSRSALVLALALAGLSISAKAAEPADQLVAVNREISLQATGLHRSYKEVFGPGFVQHDRENGWVAGLTGSATWMGTLGPVPNAFASLQASWNGGALGYRGTLFNAATPLEFQSGLSTGVARAEIGKGFALGPRLVLIPVLEGGYLWWGRDLGPGQVEDYRAGFVGVGLRADLALTPRLTARARASADTLISPAVRISYARSYDLSLGGRPRYDASLGLDYRLSGRVHLTATAELAHYGFGASQPVDTVERGRIFEPASWTNDLRLGAGLAYAF